MRVSAHSAFDTTNNVRAKNENVLPLLFACTHESSSTTHHTHPRLAHVHVHDLHTYPTLLAAVRGVYPIDSSMLRLSHTNTRSHNNKNPANIIGQGVRAEQAYHGWMQPCGYIDGIEQRLVGSATALLFFMVTTCQMAHSKYKGEQ